MASRDWNDVFSDAVARLGPARASRVLRAAWRIVHATTGMRPQVRVRFLELAMFGAELEASADAVRRRIPDVFEVVEHEPGRCSVAVQALDYRKIDLLPPYRELAITVPVRYRGQEGQLVLEMPVTTEEARWGGVIGYGFPKIVADIRMEREDGWSVCRASAAGAHILTVRVPDLPDLARRTQVIRSFNVRDDDLVTRASFDLVGEMGRAEEPGAASLELGDHAIAAGLRALEITIASRAHFAAPHASAILGRAEELGSVRLPRAPERPSRPWHAVPA